MARCRRLSLARRGGRAWLQPPPFCSLFVFFFSLSLPRSAEDQRLAGLACRCGNAPHCCESKRRRCTLMGCLAFPQILQSAPVSSERENARKPQIAAAKPPSSCHSRWAAWPRGGVVRVGAPSPALTHLSVSQRELRAPANSLPPSLPPLVGLGEVRLPARDVW